MKKRGAFEFSFSWLFALIVGAFILFLAIFFITKFSGTQADIQDTKNAKEISTLLNPLETGFEESGKTVLTMPTGSKLSTRCYSSDEFGRQTLNLKSENYNQYSDNSNEITFRNKYLFFEKNIEGKNFYIFSKPFNFPFKVATLNYVIPISQKYCFVNTPRDIKEELQKVNLSNFELVTNLGDCQEESKTICFNKDGCSIIIDTGDFSIKKDSTFVFYADNTALMFAGIFSDSVLYECQLQRLLKRASLLAEVYTQKYYLDQEAGCAKSSITDYLSYLETVSLNIENSEELSELSLTVLELENKNSRMSCQLW